MKRARELRRRSAGRRLYLLDERTPGFLAVDVAGLPMVLCRLVDANNTLLKVEHRLDAVSCADWVIGLRREGGDGGACIAAEGTPGQAALAERSASGGSLWTPRFPGDSDAGGGVPPTR